MTLGLLVLTGLVLLTGLIGNIVVTMTGGDAGSLNAYSSDVLGKLFPLLALVVGYLFGRHVERKSGSRSRS